MTKNNENTRNNRFSMLDSLNDILSTPGLKKWFGIFFNEEQLQLFPRELWDQPMRLIAYRGVTPWGSNLQGLAEQIVDTANLILELLNGERRCLHLRDWKNWEPDADGACREQNTDGICREQAIDSTCREQNFVITPRMEEKTALKPALIICPGGGYEYVSFQNEGTPIQNLAERQGYAAFVLRYRVAPFRYPDPQMDLLETIQYVREHAAEYYVDPKRIAIIGFSAGGHLCASASALYRTLLPEAEPNAVALGYPVISFEKGVTHEGSVFGLLGRDDEELRRRFSVENMIENDYPPTFAWACEDDGTVPCENTKRLEARLQDKGIAHECRYYPYGGHGCGLAYDNSAWSWSVDLFSFLKKHI